MASKRVPPSDEDMKPPVYEEGTNVGPNFSSSLDCEHLDADLYRSRPVSDCGSQKIDSLRSADRRKLLLHRTRYGSQHELEEYSVDR